MCEFQIQLMKFVNAISYGELELVRSFPKGLEIQRINGKMKVGQ